MDVALGKENQVKKSEDHEKEAWVIESFEGLIRDSWFELEVSVVYMGFLRNIECVYVYIHIYLVSGLENHIA